MAMRYDSGKKLREPVMQSLYNHHLIPQKRITPMQGCQFFVIYKHGLFPCLLMAPFQGYYLVL